MRSRGSDNSFTHHLGFLEGGEDQLLLIPIILGFGEIEEDKLTFLPINLDLGKE
jgi:hypothetical protein